MIQTITMNDNIVCKALVDLTGLDEESIKTQILPYLKSIKTQVELEDYLTSLIGQGQKQSEFIERFGNSIFRKKPDLPNNIKNESAFPSLPSNQKTSHSLFSNSPMNKVFATVNRRPKGKQAQSSTKTESDLQTVEPTVYKRFGNPDNVYMKTRDSDNCVPASSPSKKNKSKTGNSESVTPEPKPNIQNDVVQPKHVEKPAKPDSKSDLQPEVGIPISELSPSILKEIFQVAIILESIESPNAFPRGTAQCFCEARIHGQPLGRLPKQCVNCGLIFCKLKPALSPCPSCNESSRLSTNSDLRENIRSEFIKTRNSLIEIEIVKYKQRLSLDQQKAILAREAERDYPTLPIKPSIPSNNSTRAVSTGKNLSYSGQFDSGHSIQNQIKLGYDRLAKEFEDKSTSKPVPTIGGSKSKSKPHTVVRLHPNGKTKIITTIQKGNKDERQEVKLDQILNPRFLGTLMEGGSQDSPRSDPYDDLLRIKSNNLDPVLFVEKKLHPVVPKYVPIGVYQV